MVSVVIVLGIGLYFYSRQAIPSTPGQNTPKTAIDVVAVRNDLLAIARAERAYWVSNAKYGSLDDLRNNGDHIPNRADYSYSAETSETAFKIVATYTGGDPKAPRRLSIDETMALRTE